MKTCEHRTDGTMWRGPKKERRELRNETGKEGIRKKERKDDTKEESMQEKYGKQERKNKVGQEGRR